MGAVTQETRLNRNELSSASPDTRASPDGLCSKASLPSGAPTAARTRVPTALYPGPQEAARPSGDSRRQRAAAPPVKGVSAQSHRDGQAAQGCRAIRGQRPLSFFRGERTPREPSPETLQKHPRNEWGHAAADMPAPTAAAPRPTSSQSRQAAPLILGKAAGDGCVRV